MASLLIATPFVLSNALKSSAIIADVRGFHGQKTSRLACRRAPVSAAHRADSSDTAERQDAITVRQSLSSPLLNLSPADLIAAFLEDESHKEAPEANVTRTLQQLEPLSEVREVSRRRSGRVIFTAEKARLLRKENRATQTFHDKWYHSASASKLATPK